jgi:hypothetical protein
MLGGWKVGRNVLRGQAILERDDRYTSIEKVVYLLRLDV